MDAKLVQGLPWKAIAAGCFLFTTLILGRGAPATTNDLPSWLAKPLSLPEAIEIALRQNANILKSKADIEANQGIVLQTRSIAFPVLRNTGEFTANDPGLTEQFPRIIPIPQPDQRWRVSLQLIQSLYEGGRIRSAWRAARLSREQALLQYQTAVADTLLEVYIAYYDVLLAEQQIGVQEASVNLLAKELADTQSRFDAGTVPRFNVLRAEVELANARPRLIRARNTLRIARNNLATSLGFNIPRHVFEEIPLQLNGKLEAFPYEFSLPVSLGKALEDRPEIGVLRKEEALRRERIVDARAGYKPSIQAFGGYAARNSNFSENLTDEVHGWTSGVQMSWNWFDGFLTKGRVQEARALHSRSIYELDDTSRRIEQEVRTAYSTFIEAQEVLESQRKVQEQAEEALRLAKARNEAGTGTQLDVLSAQTALTEARSTQVQALRDYAVARSQLERATGQLHPRAR